MTRKSGGNSLTHKYLPNIQKLQIDITIDFTYQTPHLQKKTREKNYLQNLLYLKKLFKALEKPSYERFEKSLYSQFFFLTLAPLSPAAQI